MKTILCALILLVLSNIVAAQTVTGSIETIHSNLNTRIVYVYLEGKPTFIGNESCSSEWAAISMNNTDFRDFVLPLLITAQSTNQQVNITVDGCVTEQPEMPQIQWVDLHPRQSYPRPVD
ncbi:hypothetical protein [Methylophaga thalassica]|uniref:hypothetical protein n=1 Tax=Methylophaga TaxID=40222 RepID=UPI002E7B0D6C|nr:hypothetical protein [Methylophaga thalassica]WVI85463.1 hypothetical protein VSX76_02330 [Methylophaga thalassica]